MTAAENTPGATLSEILERETRALATRAGLTADDPEPQIAAHALLGRENHIRDPGRRPARDLWVVLKVLKVGIGRRRARHLLTP